jgi:hypothetical protein
MRRASSHAAAKFARTFADPGLLGGPRMAIQMFCPRRVQRTWYRGTDVPMHEMPHQIERSAPIWPIAAGCGIHVHSQAAFVGSVAWIKHGTRRLIDG